MWLGNGQRGPINTTIDYWRQKVRRSVSDQQKRMLEVSQRFIHIPQHFPASCFGEPKAKTPTCQNHLCRLLCCCHEIF
ncbi:hypothetical protein CKAN_02574800 [Cinnamomum micranthum f. kanehirae]|uniref:Uncharacterized protein n=1 Tax=Cinnamomum micranthum f. kanehirae TaxID=337451 RepID=A0A443Q035_9MAGN|nr:hypothetical protein CKAN_02574800 [Cinnamomum micranthum f. kanehirae]